MKDFEELLEESEANIVSSMFYKKKEDIIKNPTIQKANNTANLRDLFKMLSKLVRLTLTDLNVEFIPDELVRQVTLPDKKIDKNYITYIVKSRTVKDELKPRIRETISEVTNKDDENRIGEIYGQRFKSIVQFNILSNKPNTAEVIMERFEQLISTYTGYIKKQGIAEILFKEQLHDTEYLILRQNLSVRNIRYYVETERLTVIFKEKIKQIEIMLREE